MNAKSKSLPFVNRWSLLAVCVLATLLTLPFLVNSLLLHPASAQTPETGTDTSTPLHTDAAQAGCCGDEDADKPHLLAGSYYSVQDNLSATLMLNNKGPKPLEVQPTLFSLAGERLEVAPVTVEANKFRNIDLREWVAAAGPQFQEGSIQLFHRGKDLVLGAQIYLVDEACSLSFEEKLIEPANSPSARLEGVWWLPSRNGDVRLVLSNTTDSPLSVTASVEGERPREAASTTLELLAHETRVLDVQQDIVGRGGKPVSDMGGISIEHSGANGAVVARAMAQDAAIGYSLPVQFTDPKAAKSSKLQAAGLRLGRVADELLTPVVVARNLSDTPTVLTGRMPYTASNGQMAVVTLPELRLEPGEITTVDLARAIIRSGLRQGVAAAGLEFEYSTEPGSVAMLALSVSRSGNQVFRPPLWDIKAQRSATGGYPWYIDGDSSTMVYIKNVTDQPQQYTLQLDFDGGVYGLGLKSVEAGQTGDRIKSGGSKIRP